MDSRHESEEQEILNELIDSINIYILDNLDEILVRESLLEDIKSVSRSIYAYAQISIDVEDYLSKKNFLSIDVVCLPKINDAAILKNGANTVSFSKVFEDLHAMTCSGTSEDYFRRNFKSDIQRLLNKHKIENI